MTIVFELSAFALIIAYAVCGVISARMFYKTSMGERYRDPQMISAGVFMAFCAWPIWLPLQIIQRMIRAKIDGDKL